MKILGFTDDGCRITKSGGVTTTETTEARDERREEEAYELVRNTAPELLQATRGLLAVVRGLGNEIEFSSDDKVAVGYALEIVRKVDPDYGRAQEPPPAVEVTP